MEDNRNKRKDERDFESRKRQDLGGTVAKHYNSRNDQGLKERERSRIFYMRNYNNWIKSMLINDALRKLPKQKERISVLDLCSGKGGDLLKWKVAGIGNLVCVDIASTSVEHCKTRYEDLVKRSGKDRNPLFTAKFFAADCTKERICELDGFAENERFDLTSCQFALHYSFESLSQARMMLKNACERLKVGGLLIGTIPNANVLVKRLRDSNGMSFGNSIYRVEFDVEDKLHLPLFGAKYHFFLEGVVNCPEFLVYFPLLEDLAKDEGMKLVHCFPFKEHHDIHSTTDDGKNLLRKMSALEPFPPQQQQGGLLGDEAEDYDHARSVLATRDSRCQVFTLSKQEWEATNLYSVFMFEKVRESSDV